MLGYQRIEGARVTGSEAKFLFLREGDGVFSEARVVSLPE